MISQGTDYVGVPDDQLRWDTTRATISCSLRYKLVTSECNLAHLEIVCSRLHVLWKMLYLSFSRIACRLCLCVSFDLSRGVHIILSLSSFCCLVEKNNKQQLSNAPALSQKDLALSVHPVYFFVFLLMKSGGKSPYFLSFPFLLFPSY